MNRNRLDHILKAAAVVLEATTDLRRDNSQKIAISVEDWDRLVAAAVSACDPDTRDDSQLSQRITTVRGAIRHLKEIGRNRFHASMYRDHQWLSDLRRAEFSEAVARLQAAVDALAKLSI